MKTQSTQRAEIIRPYYTESQAKESIEKKKKFAPFQKDVKWISSIPLYLPYWLVNVEMQLKDPRSKNHTQRVYTIMVNALNNRGLTLKGDLRLDTLERQGIYLDAEADSEDVRETGRLEALAGSKRMINPPPHRVRNDMRLIYYPLALVHLSVNGKEEIQVFDYYRGGLDKYFMRYLNLKDKMEEKKAVAR